ncbi:exodeoxyribonuclease I [Chitinimonas sp. BJYL2]|uniref:exodeoxyribonuclease I n=1 Tax=Chitinimonas sp. BJYL2 TaxID=2976696 RepID=UPI0022B3C32F|nr:exodeoxyribonuclease I [Chitinimonas sp. BJYL2]
MTEPSFFWHDYETFGIRPQIDRPAQFAGIRTDSELNEIGPPVELFCQPSDDFLPDPVSVLITGITPQQAAERGVPEPEFVARIHAELAAPGTCGLGYNTIRFDDELTRHLLWRNLYDPYAREWQNGCSRWDLLDCVRATFAFRPDGIHWPINDEGKTSFKLEHLSAANDLLHEAAHDAVSDVRATIALARLIRRHNPRLFDFCHRLRKKDAVASEIGALDGHGFWHVSGMYPTSQGCVAAVAALGAHPVNKNEIPVWDLQHDPRELFDLDADTLRRRMFSRSDDLPKGETRLPIKTIHLNKSPVVVGQWRTLGQARAEALGIDIAQAEHHAATLAGLLAQHGKALAAKLAAVYRRDEAFAQRDVDAALYDRFVGDGDRRRLERLRQLGPDELARAGTAFDDPRLATLLFRYRARNWPATLNADEQAQWQQHRAERLIDGAHGLPGIADWRATLLALREQHASQPDKLDLLDALAAFADSQIASIHP